MKRILPYSLILAAGAAFACGKQGTNEPVTGEPNNTEPTDQDSGAGDDAGSAPDTAPPPGSEDPTGNPILLGEPKTVRTFAPPGGTPDFVDGPQWSMTKDALFVSLPLAANLAGGKGILTVFKSDGTNYTELRAGDKVTTGVVGNSVDKDGNLISAELKSITRTNAATGTVSLIATGYTMPGPDGGPVTPFDAPNDLVALDDGTIYFTDPGYGVDPYPAVSHLGRVAAGGLSVTRVATYDYNPSPNGIALSKDQKTLFVGFTAPGDGVPPYVRRYTINADRSLTDNGKFLEVPMGSAPDGIAVDENDNLYIALSTGIAVFKTNGTNGEAYGGAAAKVPQTTIAGGPTSVAFGGADKKSLFVTTTDGKVLMLRVKVAGLVQ